MSQFKEVDILEDVLDEKYWSFYNLERVEYTGHCYYKSPYESCDSCGNCDGARCDVCKEIKIPPKLECAIVCTDLEEILTKKGLPEDVVGFFTYDDSCRTVYQGYHFTFPTDELLKKRYPEKYNEILEICKNKKE